MYLPFTSCCHLPCSSCCTFKTLWYISIRHATCHVHSIPFHSIPATYFEAVSEIASRVSDNNVIFLSTKMKQYSSAVEFASFPIVCFVAHVWWKSEHSTMSMLGVVWTLQMAKNNFWRSFVTLHFLKASQKGNKKQKAQQPAVFKRTIYQFSDWHPIIKLRCFYRWPKWW